MKLISRHHLIHRLETVVYRPFGPGNQSSGLRIIIEVASCGAACENETAFASRPKFGSVPVPVFLCSGMQPKTEMFGSFVIPGKPLKRFPRLRFLVPARFLSHLACVCGMKPTSTKQRLLEMRNNRGFGHVVTDLLHTTSVPAKGHPGQTKHWPNA